MDMKRLQEDDTAVPADNLNRGEESPGRDDTIVDEGRRTLLPGNTSLSGRRSDPSPQAPSGRTMTGAAAVAFVKSRVINAVEDRE